MVSTSERRLTLAEERQQLVAASYLHALGCEGDAATMDAIMRKFLTQELLEHIDLSPYDNLTSLSDVQLEDLAREICVDVMGKDSDDASALALVKSWLPYVLDAMESAERAIHRRMLEEGPNLF